MSNVLNSNTQTVPRSSVGAVLATLTTSSDPGPLETAPEDSPEVKQRKQLLEIQAAAAKRHEQVLEDLPGDLNLDTRAIEVVLNEHRSSVPEETMAFMGCTTVDALIKKVSAIVDGTERKAAIGKMKKAKEEVRTRRRSLGDLLKGLNALSQEEIEQKYAVPQVTAIVRARQILPMMTDHIPDEFYFDQGNFDHVKDRLDTLALSDEQKQVEKKRLAKLVTEPPSGAAKDELDTFKEIIEPLGVKSFARIDSYFDPLMGSPTREDEARLKTALDAAIKRAHAVHDCGGTTKEVEEQLQHIPRTWWPPQFVKEFQAWRMVERAMLEEAVDKRMNPIKEATSPTEIASGVLSAVSGVIGLIGPALPEGQLGTEITKQIGTAAEDLNTVIEQGDKVKQLVEELKTKKLSELTLDQQQLATSISDFFNTASTAVSSAKEFSETAGDALGDWIPGLAIAAGGADFIKAALAIAKQTNIKGDALKMIERAEMQRACGERDDGGVMENSLRNEETARQRIIDEERLNMLKAGVAVTSGALAMAHVAAPAALGVMIVGKAITYGGKIYFANIDFNYAQQAKKTLEEARGNPIARIQIFEDSGTYAKMYIALLVQDDDPLAIEFIVKRGYRDSDVDRPDVAATILRDFLMKAASQEKELETTDSRLEATAKGVLGGAPDVIKAIVEKAGEFFSDIGKDRGVAYDADWSHVSTDVQMTIDAWNGTWEKAVPKGLYVVDPGVSTSLQAGQVSLAVFGAYTYADLVGMAGTSGTGTPLRKKNNVIDGYRKMTGLQNALMSYQPLHNPPDGDRKKLGVHAGMARYVSAMLTDCGKIKDFMDAKMQETGWLEDGTPRTLDWTHSNDDLTVAGWNQQSAEALKQAWLRMTPAGLPIAGKLKAVETAAGSSDLNITNPTGWQDAQKLRTAREACKNALDDLMVPLTAYWGECEHPGLRNYIDALKKKTATKLREMDSSMFPDLDQWNPSVNGLAPDAKFDSDKWIEAYNEGMNNGHVSPDPAGEAILNALTAWKKADTSLNGDLESIEPFQLKSGKSDKDVQVKRHEVMKTLKDIYMETGKYSAKLDTPGLKDYVNFLCVEAQQRNMKWASIGANVDFVYAAWTEPKLTSTNWTLAYNAAVKAGAVPADNSTQKALGKKLDDWQRELATFRSKKTRGLKRAEINNLTRSATDAQNAIQDMTFSVGYADNKKMDGCLGEMRELITGQLQSVEVQNLLQGVGADFPNYSGSVWDYGHWRDVLKIKALDEGLLETGAQTGLGKALNNGDMNYREFKRVVSQKLEEKLQIQYKTEAMNAFAELLSTSQKLSTVPHPNFKKYIERIVSAATERRDELKSMPAGEFRPSRFQWTDASWQKVKYPAIWAGAMEDKRSTGFGKAVEKAKKQHDSFRGATKASDIEKFRKSSEEALKIVIEKATAFREASNNVFYKDYMKQCLDEANAWLQELSQGVI